VGENALGPAPLVQIIVDECDALSQQVSPGPNFAE
jgi:hypothetical protein